MKSVLFDFFHNLDSTKKIRPQARSLSPFWNGVVVQLLPQLPDPQSSRKTEGEKKGIYYQTRWSYSVWNEKNIYEYPIDFF